MGLFGGDDLLDVGATAPDFALEDQTGAKVRLSELAGKNVVLFFYPKDDTPVCTKESCEFRDENEAFGALDAVILGVSNDSVASHERFARRHDLPYQLLADTAGEARKKYGVRGGMLPGRVTFVIDKQGVIRHRETANFQASKHVQGAREALAKLG